MRQVLYERTARRALDRMPAGDRHALDRKLRHYAATGEGDVKKLVGTEHYRLRHGDWRAIFILTGDVVVVKIAHRREAYAR
ncbi:hypothetical protein GCM10011390_29360 [Aureimonas endophytica]|uniref:mRNA interferase RelE/StbE n=1 Tax=Aureimonas endophytica TaxID=2027858 RepID=A0A916ZPY3_9HYPH|nr:type II toxin-antitoxin system RelE/ParE family toxin [Aureimonas endophytica]GGE08406.1 hypothetical protein GCM10011390_29360 [Aureimonas endophytica]